MSTETKNDFKAPPRVITAKNVADQIIAAFEGGSNYWMDRITKVSGHERATEQPWYADEKVWEGDFLVKIEADDDAYYLKPETIQKGLETLQASPHQRCRERIDEIISETGDAETADVFLQHCLFGEVVYG